MNRMRIRQSLYAARASLFEACQTVDDDKMLDEGVIPLAEESLLQTKKHIESALLLLKKRSLKRRRVSPKGKQSNVRKADVARSAKRRKE